VSKKNHGEHEDTGKKVERAVRKKDSTYLATKLIPVVPVTPLVGPLLSSTQDWD
jgi:hypothetical protein